MWSDTNEGQSSQQIIAPFHSLSFAAASNTAQSCTCISSRTCQGWRVGAVFLDTSHLSVESPKRTPWHFCVQVIYYPCLSRPHRGTNKFVGGADCSAWCSVYIVSFVLITCTSSVSVIVRSVTALAPNDTICRPGSRDNCLVACLLPDKARCHWRALGSQIVTWVPSQILSTTHSATVTYSG